MSIVQIISLETLKIKLPEAEKIAESVKDHPIMGKSWQDHVEEIKARIKQLESEQL